MKPSNYTLKLFNVKNKQYFIVIEQLVSSSTSINRRVMAAKYYETGYTNLDMPDNVIEDTTAALRLDPGYLKALNRRAMALEQVGGMDSLYLSLCG